MSHERALIGSALLAGDRHLLVDVKPADFADRFCGEVWAEMLKHSQIDLTVMASRFGEHKLTAIINETPTMVHMGREAERVKDAAYRRRLSIALNKAASMAADANIGELSNFVIRALDGVPGSKDSSHISEILTDSYRYIERAQQGEAVNFIQTGFRAFDEAIGGMKKTGLVVIAGRPSMGKTAFASGIARKAAERGPVLMVSMEMDKGELGMRFMAAEGGVDLQRMMQGKLAIEDFRKLNGAIEKLRDLNIYVNDLTSRDVQSVCAEARRFKRAHPDMQCIIIDYLTLLRLDGENRVQAIGEASRSFKVLAGELGCPVVLLSQLSRKVEERANKRPLMSDLRDSGAIEQDADQIIFPFREEVYEKKEGNEGLAEIIVAKNRNGKVGVVRMAWRAMCASFADLDRGEF